MSTVSNGNQCTTYSLLNQHFWFFLPNNKITRTQIILIAIHKVSFNKQTQSTERINEITTEQLYDTNPWCAQWYREILDHLSFQCHLSAASRHRLVFPGSSPRHSDNPWTCSDHSYKPGLEIHQLQYYSVLTVYVKL